MGAACLPAPRTAIAGEWESGVQSLKDMGFASFVANEAMIKADGDMDAALEAALAYEPPAPPAAALVNIQPQPEQPQSGPECSEWDLCGLMEELVEMGFEDTETNQQALLANHGDLKDTVSSLVNQERAMRA